MISSGKLRTIAKTELYYTKSYPTKCGIAFLSSSYILFILNNINPSVKEFLFLRLALYRL